MATYLTVTASSAAVCLFLLFTFSYARVPLDLPENDVTAQIGTASSGHEFPDSESKIIILPSEKPESEPATVVEIEPEGTETTESKDSATPQQESIATDSVPLTVVTFRPVNRHFAGHPFFPFRHGHRCHGRRHHHFNQFKLTGNGENGQRSYGNDMIDSREGNNHGFDRQIPARWASFNHGENRFNEDGKREEMNDQPHHHQHHHHDHEFFKGGFMNHHHHHHDHDDEHVHEFFKGGFMNHHQHEHHHHQFFNGGFTKGIRKFLNNF